jgi:DNA-binding TFAR19-related protein (PDSD5 family)
MVVALDLERDRLAVAEVENPGVLSRALKNAFAGGRQALQQQRRVLVAAMLRPEQREDRQLEVVRVATEQFADTVELSVRQAESAVERLFGDPRQGPESRRDFGRNPVAGRDPS